ncbi:hypothetical protein MLD38_022410 [Melastoma candidum]|uniref:Uncharacterized protein n=1 Tax=Melastoma candidum TaxID=119954 RepID=A0ACB9QJQ6_9MYRT|nr:hypothetical protein MLD38_022410 [Melastoma candidum]
MLEQGRRVSVVTVSAGVPCSCTFLISLFFEGRFCRLSCFGSGDSPGEGKQNSMRWWLNLAVDVYRKVISLNLYCRVIL